MANPYFRFKQFTIWHDKCAMKVGTDGVLLGAWADVEQCRNILDVGTGTGLIALMLAQRCAAQIDAIDIDRDAFLQAGENISASPFAAQVQAHHSSFADFIPQVGKQYDRIVSNPPYFADSLKCPDQKRTTARHTDSLLLSDLVAGSSRLLSPGGRLALILPSDQKDKLQQAAEANQLSAVRLTHVVSTPGASPKRLLIEYSNLPSSCLEDELIIEEARHLYTPRFKALTHEFYLK